MAVAKKKRTRPAPKWGWRTKNVAGGWLAPDGTIHAHHPNALAEPIKEIRYGYEFTHPKLSPEGWRRISTYYKALDPVIAGNLIRFAKLPKQLLPDIEEQLELFRYLRVQEAQQPSIADVRKMLLEYRKVCTGFLGFVESGLALNESGLDERTMNVLQWSADQENAQYFELAKSTTTQVRQLLAIIGRGIAHAATAKQNRTPLSELLLTFRIVEIVKKAGLRVSTSRSGTVCKTLEYLLDAEGIARQDVQQLVRSVLKSK